MGYGAAVLYPMKLEIGGPAVNVKPQAEAGSFGWSPEREATQNRIGPAQKPPLRSDASGAIIPDHGASLTGFNTLLGE